MSQIERLERAITGDITVDEIVTLIDYSNQSLAQFWAQFQIHPSTWHRWKNAEGPPVHVRARILTWWALKWAQAEAELELMTAGKAHQFRSLPPKLAGGTEAAA